MLDNDIEDVEIAQKEKPWVRTPVPGGLSTLPGSFKKTQGRHPILTQHQAAEAWDDYVLGSNILQLALKFKTSPAMIQQALTAIAVELGYPEKHLDPEMERFRGAEASDRTKDSIIKILAESNTVIKDYMDARTVLLDGKTLAELVKSKKAEDQERAKMIFALNTMRQSELKIVNGYLAEYRQINNFLAEITGVKKIKITRKPKKVTNVEDVIDKLSDDELRALAESSD